MSGSSILRVTVITSSHQNGSRRSRCHGCPCTRVGGGVIFGCRDVFVKTHDGAGLTTEEIKYNERAGTIKDDIRKTQIKHELVRRPKIENTYLPPEEEETLRLEPTGQEYVAQSSNGLSEEEKKEENVAVNDPETKENKPDV